MNDRPPKSLRFGFQLFDVTRPRPEWRNAGQAAHVVRISMPACRMRTMLAHAEAANLNRMSAGRPRCLAARRPARIEVMLAGRPLYDTVLSAARSSCTSFAGRGT